MMKNEIFNMKNFNPSNIKIHENSWENIFIYYTGYVTIKYCKYVKINGVNPSYLIFSKVNEWFEEISKIKYLMLIPTNQSKEKNMKN